MSGDAPRGAAEIDGFTVAIDELERFRLLLGDTVDTHVRASRAEIHSDALGGESSGSRGSGRAGVLVPDWHDELDRRWTDQRARMLDAHDEAARSLAEVARSYQIQDAYIATILSTDTAAARTPLHPDEPGDSDQAAGGARLLRVAAAEITDLQRAVVVWATRGAASHETVRLLRASLDDLTWRGPAATAFHDWMDVRIRRWAGLARSADIIAEHLVDAARRDHPHDTGPDVPDLIRTPARAPNPFGDLLAGPLSARGPSDVGDHFAEAGFGPGAYLRPTVEASSPADPLDQVAPAHPDTSAAVPEPGPTTSAADDQGQYAHAEPADEAARPDHSAVPPDNLAAGGHHPIPPSTAPDPGQTQISDPRPGHDSLAAEPRHDTVPREPAAPDPPAPPVGAVAGAAALARQDRAHYVVRDIAMPTATAAPTAPPQPDTATPPAPRGTGNPATAPDPGSLPQHPTPPWAAAGRPAGAASPASMPPGADTAFIGPDAYPAAGRVPRQRRTSGHAPVWVNLNPPGPPAWIDLTAGPGLGLDGPGATDVLRTAIAELHQHTPAVLVIPERQLTDLLRGAGDPTGPRTTAAPHGQLHLVDHPYNGLQELLAHAESHPHRAAQTRPPRVLIAPTPTTHQALDDLATTLEDARAYRAAAVLLGPWPHGLHLTVDSTHHVAGPTRPASNSPDLTGVHLHPTSPRELAEILAGQNPPLAERRPGAPDHDTSETDPTDTSGPDTELRPRTRLALTVLGPVELRYRRSHEPDPAQPDPTDEILTVPRLAGPARELLAYLAAHPDGATRDTIIEAIWPRTTAGRTDTTFHTTISRLRKRIRDTTDDEQADPITVNNGRWRINPATVTVDYWTLLETSTHTTNPTRRRQAYRTAVALYNGLFAVDITGEWAHTIREATRRRYLEIITDLSEIEIQHDPAAALDLLERARNMEPFNESVYRSIMRIQLSDDRYQSVRNTYELLKVHLDEIDAVPQPETVKIAERALTA